ncbi:MAG: hypothetical protein LBU33_02160 [Endomicrobium sp.]|nr:hypothetical protein [Endomicrobium sp.]
MKRLLILTLICTLLSSPSFSAMKSSDVVEAPSADVTQMDSETQREYRNYLKAKEKEAKSNVRGTNWAIGLIVGYIVVIVVCVVAAVATKH